MISPLNDARKMITSHQITFFGKPSIEDGFNRKIGVLYLTSNAPNDFENIFFIAKTHFLNECDVKGAKDEFLKFGCTMELHYKDDIYGHKSNKTYKLMNPQLN